MLEENIEDRLQNENIVELGLKTRSHFFRLTPNGADVHDRNNLARVIYQTGIYAKRKIGEKAIGSELRKQYPKIYGPFVENIQKAVKQYGFCF